MSELTVESRDVGGVVLLYPQGFITKGLANGLPIGVTIARRDVADGINLSKLVQITTIVAFQCILLFHVVLKE